MRAERSRWTTPTLGLALQLLGAMVGCEPAADSALPRIGDAAPVPGSPPAAAKHPPIIICLIDTLRADHLGLYGYERDTSPFLDALAEEAIVFERAASQASWTRPSVGTLFTGLYPSRHGAIRREHRLRADVDTLAERLSAAGYHTAAFVRNPNVVSDFGFDRGFDRFEFVDEPKQTQGSAESVHAAALEHLDARPDAPLFLYVHTLDPHAPYDPPAPFDTRFTPGGDKWIDRAIALYDGEIAYSDSALEAFVSALRERGLFDSALFVVLSDHGEEFGEHAVTGHGQTLHQIEIHVPLLIRLPDGRLGGTRIVTPVGVADLLPTILSAIGVETPPNIDGRSLLPLLRPGSEPLEREVFSEQNLGKNVLASLVSGGTKVIRRYEPGDRAGVLLFDLEQDPEESSDLAAAQPERAQQLLAALDLVESGLSSGVHVAFANARGTASERRLAGSVLAIDARFTEWHVANLEEGDRVVYEDGERIAFDLTLANRANPTLEEPLVLVDVDRIRFRLEPPDASFRIELDDDSAPAGRFDLLLGVARKPRPLALPFTSRDGDREISMGGHRPSEFSARNRPYAHVFSIPHVAAASAEIDDGLDARLRALGYVDDDMPESLEKSATARP